MNAESKIIRQPILFCFAGPGGCGKSSICEKLVEDEQTLRLSISTTTRAPRAGEVEGKHYYFVSREQFDERVRSGSFLEYAEFGGNLYGTERINLEAANLANKDLILDIEVQGVRQIRAALPEQTVTVFVFPPSFAELEKRLRLRGTDSPERVALRLKTAEGEISVLRDGGFADYLLINDSRSQAAQDALKIVGAERLRLRRYSEEFLDRLINSGRTDIG